MIGKIIKVMGRYYTIQTDEKIYKEAVLRGIIRKDKRLKQFSDPVATGDIVEFEINKEGSPVISSIKDRKNVFTRKDKMSNKQDLIASNLDRVVVIQALLNPKFNLRFVDRILVRSEKENIPFILCMNKLDLKEENSIKYIKSYYKGADIKIIYTSCVTNEGIAELSEELNEGISILVGSSGVGKSNILNKLYPDINLKTGAISESTGKGKHTTTNVELIKINPTTGIIDTPGIKEFGLVDIEPIFLGDYFHEFKEYSKLCKFKPCAHYNEPHCEVKYQVENKTISLDRYISYKNIYNSLKDYYDNRY